LASSLCCAPLAFSRQVTPFATVVPPSSEWSILTTNASVTSVARLPPRCHASAVSAIGT
jgi:hypothetical protein